MVKENFEIQPFQMLQIDSKYHDNSRNTMNARKTANPANSQYSNYFENKILMYGDIYSLCRLWLNIKQIYYAFPFPLVHVSFHRMEMYGEIFKIPGDFQVFQVFQVIFLIPGDFQEFQVFQSS